MLGLGIGLGLGLGGSFRYAFAVHCGSKDRGDLTDVRERLDVQLLHLPVAFNG